MVARWLLLFSGWLLGCSWRLLNVTRMFCVVARVLLVR